jgi:hypothetical protein
MEISRIKEALQHCKARKTSALLWHHGQPLSYLCISSNLSIIHKNIIEIAAAKSLESGVETGCVSDSASTRACAPCRTAKQQG